MDRQIAHAVACETLYREGLYLDRQDWDAWLALYSPDVVYWVPGWKTEDQLVSDVCREVSLIYHASRDGLAERVLRIRTRKSVTAMPLPRTSHMVSNVLIDGVTKDTIQGTAAWIVDEYDPRTGKSHRQFGRYEFVLQRGEDAWRFSHKKVILLNDLIPTVVDFYNL